MIDLIAVCEEYERQGISLFWKKSCVAAATIEQNGDFAVFMDANGFHSYAEQNMALIHELGHCEAGATHRLSSPFDLVEKHEYQANRAAASRWLPPEEFREAFALGHTELWDVAEYFNLPEAFVAGVWARYLEDGIL